METIKGMDDAVVARIGVSEWNQASSKQRWWLLAYKYLPRKIRVPVARIDLSNVKMEFEDAGALGSALQERSGSSNIESLIIGNDVVLQLKGKLDSDFFDASGQGMDHGYCVILAWWLTAPVTASIARISVLSNPIGVEGATALIDVYERNENLRTLLGIEEGVTELNLAKKRVD